ncbi:hypothetical protein HY639_03120 [Candidatus Woesearchaeota archaeon]|nr:hypothetical protein [Candidatus Woesearchaeota archaeon]
MTYQLSPTSLDMYNDCPKCFWLKMNKKIDRPDTPFPSLPSGMDKVIKRHFDAYRQQHLLPPELEGIDGKLMMIWHN